MPDGACIVAFIKESSLSVNENKNHTIDLFIEPESKNFENKDQNPYLENIEVSDNRSPQSQSEIVKAHIYFCTEFGKPVNKVKFESVTSNNNYNEFIIIGRETNFTQDIKKGENIVIMGERHKVIELISEERIKLAGNFSSLLNVNPWLDFCIEPKIRLNKLIDSYKLMFEKYPINSCIDNEQNKPLNLHIVLDILSDETDIDEYSTNFEDYVLDMFKDLKKETNKPQIFLKKFLTFVTTFQAKNNQFQPYRDGLSAKDNMEFIDGYHPVDSIACNISFGWYEGIFKHFGDYQVKVVSSMVVTKKYIYIALNFEGLRSLERSPQEDLFLTLLNTIMSNLILFKNQFAINRDMSSMFQRFQDGATKAKLYIIIKDVPKNDRDDVVRDFYSRFEQLVTEEGEDNFITKMYKDVKSILDEQEAKYENARIFLQNIKIIMAKLKVCDWGSLDENLVQNRTSTLKRLLHNAVYLGIEQIGEKLMFELFDNLKEKETELTLDSELILYEENTNFIHLLADLRSFFEDKIQLGKENSNDIEWFNSLEKFFRYIIDRRIIRVQEWFKQNTIRFSQDNNEIVITRYALE
ncbi:hypothetical protein C1646_755776 [Rhizophagus diaphanus]|nr:hypothetical protein C1646_755776 [Rhizophagus diaphanus] [Rhizophagus sp. MUCL 43196]